MKYDENVTISLTLRRIDFWRAFFPPVHVGGGYYDHVCVVCSWHDKVDQGYFRVDNPNPHTCPVGLAFKEIGIGTSCPMY